MTAENWEPWGVAETPQISDMAKSLVREYLKIALDLNPIWSIDQFPESEELGYVTFQIYGNDSRASRQAVWKMMVAAQESNVTRPRMVLGVFQRIQYHWPIVPRIVEHNKQASEPVQTNLWRFKFYEEERNWRST